MVQNLFSFYSCPRESTNTKECQVQVNLRTSVLKHLTPFCCLRSLAIKKSWGKECHNSWIKPFVQVVIEKTLRVWLWCLRSEDWNKLSYCFIEIYFITTNVAEIFHFFDFMCIFLSKNKKMALIYVKQIEIE